MVVNIHAQITCDVVLILLCSACAALRLYLRCGGGGGGGGGPGRNASHHRRSVPILLNDVFTLTALSSATAGFILDIIIMIRRGRIDQDRLVVEEAVSIQRLAIYWDYGYLLCVWGIKAAFLCNYAQVRAGLMPSRVAALWAVVGVNAASFLMAALSLMLWCHASKQDWADGRVVCNITQQRQLTIIVGATHLGSDFCVMLLGFLVISALRLGRREKVALVFVFILGFLTMAGAAVKGTMVLLYLENGKDMSALVFATYGEIAAGVVAVSAPSARALLRDKGGGGGSGGDYSGEVGGGGAGSRSLRSLEMGESGRA